MESTVIFNVFWFYFSEILIPVKIWSACSFWAASHSQLLQDLYNNLQQKKRDEEKL